MTTTRKWLAITAILMGLFPMGLSFSLTNINLESIQAALGSSLIQLQWMINIYGIVIASLLVTMGRLGDIFGRKKIYLIGLLFFAIAMLGAGFAPNAQTIIVFQAVFGIAGAILLPISQAMLVEIFPDKKKSTAIGLWAATAGISIAIGPLIGGILLTFLSWRSIFFINVPFAILGFVLALFFTRESRTEGHSTKIDWPGVVLLTLTIVTFVLATVQSNLWKPSIIVALYIVSAVSLVLLLVVEKKAEMPIIQESLFKSRMFLLCSLGNFCMICFTWAGVFLIPFYIQKHLGYTPFQAGLLMLGFSAPIALFSPVSGYLYNKVGPRPMIFIGFLLLTLSAIMQLQFKEVATPLFIALAVLILGLGFSLIWTPTTTGALSAISRNFAGVASGTFVTIQEIGGSVGLAITVTVVRKQTVFAEGFHDGMWVLLLISIIGVASALFIPKKSKKMEYS
ncbi:MAG: putative multidrug resistance protein EmrY [Chlamydiae bacterium]|nr:putative multidrug resistance protein EmrY [Chlamydiota bacterium]